MSQANKKSSRKEKQKYGNLESFRSPLFFQFPRLGGDETCTNDMGFTFFSGTIAPI
jgi:hypothetical protein